MKLIILVGFSKTDASGHPEPDSEMTIQGAAIAGSEASRKLTNIFAAAKQDREMQGGVCWLGIGSFEPSEVAVVMAPASSKAESNLEPHFHKSKKTK